MALDWNKEISFGEVFKALGKKGKKSTGDYPTKTTINLYVPTSTGPDLKKVVPAAIILLIAVVLFTKFGVLDQLGRVTAKEAELSDVRAQVATVESQLAGYDKLQEEYESYAPLLSASGVDASAVLSMVEANVMPSATVASANLEGATLTLDLAGVSLDTVGVIVNQLQGQSIVKSVAVTSAQTDRSDDSSAATIQVELLSSSAGANEGSGKFLGIDPNASAEAWAGAASALSNK